AGRRPGDRQARIEPGCRRRARRQRPAFEVAARRAVGQGLAVRRSRQGCVPDGARQDQLLQGLAYEVRRQGLDAARACRRPTRMTAEPLLEELASPAPGVAAPLDRLLALVTEPLAAVVVVAEVLILLTGVISRFVFNHPLTWSDELASIMFLWLAMLGSAI